MEECRFAGASLAREERVLARAFADGEHLHFRSAGAPDCDTKFLRGVPRPHLRGRWCNLREGHLDAVGINAVFPDFVDESSSEIRMGRGIENKVRTELRLLTGEHEVAFFSTDADAILAEFINGKAIGQRLALVPVNECEDAAARTARGDALEALRRGFAEACGKIRYDEKVILFRYAPSLLVVLSDRFVFVAQIHLDDLLDVLAQFRESLFDLIALCPDAAVNETLLIVRKMHQSCKALSKSDRINDGETQFARRSRREQAEDDVV